MKNPIRVALDHAWLTILVSTVMPGLVHAVIQYFRGEVSFTSIWISLGAGLVAAIFVLPLKVRQQAQPPVTIQILSQIPPTDEATIDEATINEATILAPYHLDTKRRWYPYTTKYLVDKIQNLTDVEREISIENDIGRCMRIEGAITNVRRGLFKDEEEFHATIELPNGITVLIEAKSEPWNGILRASKIGDIVEVIGAIRNVMRGDTIWLDIHEMLPPMLRN